MTTGILRGALAGAAEAALTGAAAMALSDVPLKLLGISGPASSAQDWASDAVPHLPYGAVTRTMLRSRPS